MDAQEGAGFVIISRIIALCVYVFNNKLMACNHLSPVQYRRTAQPYYFSIFAGHILIYDIMNNKYSKSN